MNFNSMFKVGGGRRAKQHILCTAKTVHYKSAAVKPTGFLTPVAVGCTQVLFCKTQQAVYFHNSAGYSVRNNEAQRIFVADVQGISRGSAPGNSTEAE
jgi:hypothetical protein